MAILKILMVEDQPTDVELSMRELKRASINFEIRRVESEPEYRDELSNNPPDIVISDFSMPKFDGLSALRISQEVQPDIPFIFVSGTIGEEMAVESLKRGATDYVLKTNLKKLPNAVVSALVRMREKTARKFAEKELQESNRLFQIFMEHLPGSAYIKDSQGRYIFANKATARALNITPEELLGKTDAALMAKAVADVVQNFDMRVFQSRSAIVEVEEIPQQGVTNYWLSTKFPLVDMDDKIEHIGCISIDITEQRKSEQDLLLRNHAIEVSAAPILIVDITQPNMPLIYVNSAFEKVTGYTRQEALGKNCNFLQGTDSNQPELEKLRTAIEHRTAASVVLRNYRKDGSLFINELYIVPVQDPHSGQVRHFVGVQNDVTQIKRYQEDLERQANYDSLTGLANRNLLNERLRQLLLEGQRYNRVFTVAFIDIDNFKLINDSLGHSAGDELIAIISRRLQNCVRDEDTVARLGGDEFVLLLTGQSYEESNHQVIKRIRSEVARPVLISDKQLTITCSIGLASYPRDGEDGETLLSNADVAMYRAKSSGRNNFQFYAKEMNVATGERLSLQNDLWHALKRDEFYLHYQPQVDLRSGHIIGMEALIRWQHPSLGVIPPLNFIPLAESDGLIVPIGEWVMEKACRDNWQLQKDGYSRIPVAVNLSARQLEQKNLLSAVQQALEKTALDPHYLELEVTESMMMHNVEEVIDILNRLSAIGVQLSLDDFGTGYSNLAYLKRFPIDKIKIDKSFIRDIVTDPSDALICGSIIALAHSLQHKVIAEGVENEQQLEFLKANGCDEAQGYFFSKPEPIATIRQRLSLIKS